MGSVFQHWAAQSSTFILDSSLRTLVESRRRLVRSTTIRWSLRTLGVSSSSVIKASTRASGGYTPFTLEQESRLCKKAESSGASSGSSSFNLSIRTESSWASSPLKQAPYFRQPTMVAAPTRPRMSKGPMIMHICWALVRATVALAKASSFWASAPVG